MRKELGLISVLALYVLIAYTTGLTLPPDPWRSYMGLLILQVLLLCYAGPIGRRISDPAQNPGLTGPQQRLTNDVEAETNRLWFALVVFAGTFIGIIAVFCCHDSQWTGPHTDGERFTVIMTSVFQLAAGLIYWSGTSWLFSLKIIILTPFAQPVYADRRSDAQKALKNALTNNADGHALESGLSVEDTEETSALSVKPSQ